MPPTLRSRHVGKPTPSRRIVTGRRDCITGEVPSGKVGMGYRMVAYEGLLARDFILILEQDDAVLRYQEEPVPFRWHDGVRWRRYTPDFAVEIDDGRRISVEVKPRKRVIRLGWDGIRPRIEAGARAAGYDGFELWTEAEIDALRVANAALLASERTFVVDEAEQHTMRVVLDRCGGQGRVRELRAASGLQDRAFRAVVALVARGEAELADPGRPFDDHAVIRRPANPRRTP
ncbi:hypothetical protein ABID82_003314 [Methylobacterium sp. PvP062]|jgi:hypothetical protein|uniref:TnsA endonuclease N-terminal domain-containing protein n=2 Tax=Methylobacterium TaxID=407 RepID=A0ABV2NC91_9HYPH|nr:MULTISPECIES: TnsA endonuclease N-terminal domain-containing protein [Methylobacterium]MCX7335589.1 hypothetical protein [Hyphomicrobiales bacterium]AYO83178.1 hypothetical protein EBB05_13505 [Methylobacterium brachiatum]MBP2492650.1 hypothetical protein [Methylobacterium sp. PvP105]MBP2500978.1 hypothetical protein [Methylobacterium sp. PvP109]MDQ0444995.1 hypothetical protein [Methylobacterium persicinum]